MFSERNILETKKTSATTDQTPNMTALSYIMKDDDLFISDPFATHAAFMNHMVDLLNVEIKKEIPDDNTLMHKLDWFENAHAQINFVNNRASYYTRSINSTTQSLSPFGRGALEYEIWHGGKSYLMALIHTPTGQATDPERKSLRFVKH